MDWRVSLAVAVLAWAGCGKPQVRAANGSPPGSAAADGSTDLPGFGLPPPGAPAPVVMPLPPGSGEQCAEEAIGAQVIPLDLVLVLDASGSMNTDVDGRTKWSRVQEALTNFVRDPRSAGLGVGLQVFPFTIEQKPCKNDADCGDTGGPPGFLCARPFVCNDPAVPLAMARPCDPNDAFCPRGVKCVEAGRCAGSGARCLALGQACPGGAGICGMADTVCKMPIDSCTPADYQQPRVAIGELPGAESAVVQGLAAVMPAGGTPIAPAFDGAAAHLRGYLQAHAGHAAALVLATDGGPNGCTGNDVPGVAMRLAAAHTGAPPLPTYVIGVVSAGNAAAAATFQTFATAGGTGAPFLLNAAGDLGQKFQAALDEIRAKALPCELAIPRPSKGAIDFGRVNVRYTGPAGPDDLFYVTSADRCDPVKGGWYYDVLPSAGTPTRIRVCEATCRRFQMEPGGKIELRFGCRTRVIE
jgi:hypothetical protein